jgi:hypothetical protein
MDPPCKRHKPTRSAKDLARNLQPIGRRRARHRRSRVTGRHPESRRSGARQKPRPVPTARRDRDRRSAEHPWPHPETWNGRADETGREDVRGRVPIEKTGVPNGGQKLPTRSGRRLEDRRSRKVASRCPRWPTPDVIINLRVANEEQSLSPEEEYHCTVKALLVASSENWSFAKIRN